KEPKSQGRAYEKLEYTRQHHRLSSGFELLEVNLEPGQIKEQNKANFGNGFDGFLIRNQLKPYRTDDHTGGEIGQRQHLTRHFRDKSQYCRYCDAEADILQQIMMHLLVFCPLTLINLYEACGKASPLDQRQSDLTSR